MYGWSGHRSAGRFCGRFAVEGAVLGRHSRCQDLKEKDLKEDLNEEDLKEEDPRRKYLKEV